MRKVLIVAALLLPALSAVPARAVDQAMFNAVASQIPVPQPDKYDERAVLAALLSRPNEAAEFEADGREALNDPQLKALMIAKWRGRAAKFATLDVNRGGADDSKTYHNWKEVLGPEGYAYTRQRLLSMSKANCDKLIGYLGVLDQKLKENNFKLDTGFFGVSGKIAAGILDAYKKDLGFYLQDPAAQAARNSVAQNTTQLASAITAKKTAAAAPVTQPAAAPATPPAKKPAPVVTVPAKKPAPEPQPAPKKPEPKPEPKTPVVVPAQPDPVVKNPAGGALDQARNAARAGQNAGQVFDGGGNAGKPTAGDAVVVPPNTGAPATNPVLTPAAPGAKPPVVGEVPPPSSVLDDLDARVAKAGKNPNKPYSGKLGLIGGIGGGLLGGLIGFFIGGPIGAAIGAAALGFGGGALVKRLL